MQLKHLTDKTRVFTVTFDEKVTLRLRHITREQLRDLYKQATIARFVHHQKVEEFDAVKADCLLGRAAIEGWSGIEDGETAAECTPETIDLLMTTHNSFAKFINDICVDIDALVREEQEATRKNS